MPHEHEARGRFLAERGDGQPKLGEYIAGFDVPVVNERVVRASAGLLFLPGIVAFMSAAQLGDFGPLRLFGIAFLLDMSLRMTAGTRFAPSLVIARFIVRRQRPEWVGAAQKRPAWALGLAMAIISCLGMGWLNFGVGVILALAAACLILLFVEAAFGICLGCELQRVRGAMPGSCAGDACVRPGARTP